MKKLIILAAVLALTAVGFARQVSADVHIIGTVGGVGVGLSIDVETIERTKLSKELDLYAVKFLCGTVPGFGQFPDPGSPLAPGTYLTAINILNPGPEPIFLTKKAIETRPQVEPRDGPKQIITDVLEPEQGFEIDCDDIIWVVLGNSDPLFVMDPFAPLVKGFVIITAIKMKVRLKVVAVYTAKNVEGLFAN